MSQLGCTDQVKLTTAFYVYMELCEVKRYWDVDYKYSEPLQMFYLEAKKTKKGTLDTFIPWAAIHNISLGLISKIQQELNKEKFTFVFKEGDTSSVYYSIRSGITKLVSPEETKDLRQKAMKKFKLEREITRNTANLYERALLLAMEKQDELAKIHCKVENNLEGTATTIKIDSTDEPNFELKICSDSLDGKHNDKLQKDNTLSFKSNEVQNY
ncbi:uncharacterized protein LOC131665356 [Phymastichus coffea]|uniref:uncharacterized protein LOC131665356 n=1 Tax=Phymastichus coffea TaxID=108790 RepID=UPI00273B30AB|nr:uncharacterized protein LOC131665356 [Phymastichus coffea]